MSPLAGLGETDCALENINVSFPTELSLRTGRSVSFNFSIRAKLVAFSGL